MSRSATIAVLSLLLAGAARAATTAPTSQPGVIVHTISSDYQRAPGEIHVLLPDRFDSTRRYPVLYVLPVYANHKPTYALLYQTHKHGFKIRDFARLQNPDRHSGTAPRSLYVSHDGSEVWTGRIHECREERGPRHKFVEELESLRPHLYCQSRCPGEVALRTTKTSNQPLFNWVAARHEHDWNRRCRGFGGTPRWRSCCCDHVHIAAHEIGRQFGQRFIATLCRPVFECDVAAFHKTNFR